jgi:hypothetical protein
MKGNVVRFASPEEKENLKRNNHEGYISKKARKRLADSVDWINEITKMRKAVIDGIQVKYKLTFITLTLPSSQVNDLTFEMARELQRKTLIKTGGIQFGSKGLMNYVDDLIKRNCLNQFLTELREKHNLKLYIWRAEAQKNGNLHFHIVTDIAIHYKTVRDIWNRIVNKLGYVDEYRKEHEKMSIEDYRQKYSKRMYIKHLKREETDQEYNNRTLNAYNKGLSEGWVNPNSTDIHAVKKIRDLRKYVTKYLAKEVDPLTDRMITGRLWYISQAISEIRNESDIIASDLTDELNDLIESNKDRAVKLEHCFILQMNIADIKKQGAVLIPLIFDEKIKRIRERVYKNSEVVT